MLGTLRFRLTALFVGVVLVFALVSGALAIRLFRDLTHSQSCLLYTSPSPRDS